MSDGLQVHDVVVRYGAGPAVVTAVDHVDLDVPAGEVVALLGPSGCGKSSLLRAVAGLEPVAAGDVAWDGVSVARTPVHRRGFGLMFQDGQLFGHLDVGANVAYGLPRGRGARPARDARVAELLDLVGLPGLQRRDVATLSGGQRQRVALARALAPRPRLLLLDEPLSALDRTLRERLALDLRDVLVATGTTALLVTHDQDEAFAVADRIAVMDAGRLLQVAAPARLWARPADRRTAQLLGYEAFLDALDADAPAVRALAAHVPHPGVVALAAGAFVVVPDDDATAGPAGDVHVQRSRRGRTEVVVDVAGVGRVTALAPSAWSAAPGTRVALRVDPAGVAVLPAGS
ncbi:ABC transporter ATP-binding protein [Cellulomonas sp. SLBN-39]|uniref:ABC transporter ATP-binding protein n=1 Tax=Cellulomonas sp. SLBN-39 TaxID=2768446 RepID=UPI0011548F49|nr:ABC transporter ATP-binding protein [Cellulomonas sp. SLBN-39]TQL02554.1 thiamine transport system ATP-binding protein [Cellulomonas sp. SLBN-39]